MSEHWKNMRKCIARPKELDKYLSSTYEPLLFLEQQSKQDYVINSVPVILDELELSKSCLKASR